MLNAINEFKIMLLCANRYQCSCVPFYMIGYIISKHCWPVYITSVCMASVHYQCLYGQFTLPVFVARGRYLKFRYLKFVDCHNQVCGRHILDFEDEPNVTAGSVYFFYCRI
jgi:hypothetical protein